MQTENKNVFSLKVPTNVQISWGVDFIKVIGPLGTIVKKKGNFNCLLNDSVLYIMCDDNKGPFYLQSIRVLILGVLKAYSIKLRLIGVGYKASIVNKKLYLTFSLNRSK